MSQTIAETLTTALRSLLARKNDDAFVILDDRKTEKFVQFGRGPTLTLDLPLAALDPEETTRAIAAFERLGVRGPRHFQAPDPSAGDLLRSHATLEKDFGTDAPRAALAALEVFRAVYQLETPRFRIYEN